MQSGGSRRRSCAPTIKAAGWSQADLADKIGCSQNTVSKAEREGHKSRRFWQAADHALGTGGTLAAGFDHIHHPA
jgi:transcriptional regulator with XRE-family HTH domain